MSASGDARVPPPERHPREVPDVGAGLFRVRPGTVALLAATPLLALPALDYLMVSPLGSRSLTWGFVVFAFAALGVAALLLGALALLVPRRTRRLGLRATVRASVALPVLIATMLAGARIGSVVRRDAFADLARRSTPLVEALHAHHSDHGTPPESLDDLVPGYLPSVPDTGMRAYPAYRLETGDDAFADNPWMLAVSTPRGMLNWDEFLYLPRRNYPRQGHGGVFERIEDWAYLHE